MDTKTATEFFGQDLERLRGIAKHLGLRAVAPGRDVALRDRPASMSGTFRHAIAMPGNAARETGRCVGHGATNRSIMRTRYLAAKNSISHDFSITTWHFAVGILSSFEDLHVT